MQAQPAQGLQETLLAGLRARQARQAGSVSSPKFANLGRLGALLKQQRCVLVGRRPLARLKAAPHTVKRGHVNVPLRSAPGCVVTSAILSSARKVTKFRMKSSSF